MNKKKWHARQSKDHDVILYKNAKDIIDSLDPLGLFPGAPKNEYEPEVSEIMTYIYKVESPKELADKIHETFVKWFDLRMAGPVSGYLQAAEDIWKFRKSIKPPKKL